jgi:hypothetical protein
MHFKVLWCILLTIFSPTRFGRYSAHLQGDVLITRIQMWLSVSTSLHNNYNYIILAKIILNNMNTGLEWIILKSWEWKLFSVCRVMTEAVMWRVLIHSVGDVLSVWGTGRNVGRNMLLRIPWIHHRVLQCIHWLFIYFWICMLPFMLTVYSRYKICANPSGHVV